MPTARKDNEICRSEKWEGVQRTKTDTLLVQSVHSVQLKTILSFWMERKVIRLTGRKGNVPYPDLSIGQSAGCEPNWSCEALSRRHCHVGNEEAMRALIRQLYLNWLHHLVHYPSTLTVYLLFLVPIPEYHGKHASCLPSLLLPTDLHPISSPTQVITSPINKAMHTNLHPVHHPYPSKTQTSPLPPLTAQISYQMQISRRWSQAASLVKRWRENTCKQVRRKVMITTIPVVGRRKHSILAQRSSRLIDMFIS